MEGGVVVCASRAEGEEVLVGLLVFEALDLVKYTYLCGFRDGFAEELDLEVAVGCMELLPSAFVPCGIDPVATHCNRHCCAVYLF